MEASKKLCPRPLYLNKIRPFRDDCEMIKVLVGVRRCGKSSIMELIRRELENEGAPKENLLFLNLDAKENIDIVTALEEEFDMEIDASLVVADNFRNMDSIVEMMEGILGSCS